MPLWLTCATFQTTVHTPSRGPRALRLPLLFLACLTALVCASAGLAAQAITGTISGTVTASPTAVLAGASVTVRNETVGIERIVVTDERCRYSVDNLPVQGTSRFA